VERSDATSHVPPWYASCRAADDDPDAGAKPIELHVHYQVIAFGPVRLFDFLMLCGYRPANTYRTEPAPSATSPRRRAVCFRLVGHDSGTRGGCKRGFTRHLFCALPRLAV
jgi:hypothetical protein